MLTPNQLAEVHNHMLLSSLAEEVTSELMDQDSTLRGVAYILVKYAEDRPGAIRELTRARDGLNRAIQVLNGMGQASPGNPPH